MSSIVTSHYRPKPPRKKRKQPPIVSRIVTPAPLKPLKGPVVRLRDQANDNGAQPSQPKPSAIVTPKRIRPSIFGDAPDITPEEHQRRGNAADALFREMVRRTAEAKKERA